MNGVKDILVKDVRPVVTDNKMSNYECGKGGGLRCASQAFLMESRVNENIGTEVIQHKAWKPSRAIYF